MSVNLSLYRDKVGTFKNHNLTRFRNNYRHFKYYLYDIDTAFGVISFSCSILTTISGFGILVRNTIKIFLFSRFREIKGVFVSIFGSTFFVAFLSRKLFLSGDNETNPEPWRSLSNHFNSISAHNFAKVQLLKEYLAVHKFDDVCLSEPYLNSSFPDNDNLDIPGYIMVRNVHPTNGKCGDVCMYYKNCISLKVLDIRFLHESIVFELRIGDKLCSFISL